MLEGDALVFDARVEQAHAELRGHEVGTGKRLAAVEREVHLHGQARRLDHALRQAADDLELLLALGNVDEPQLADGQLVVALDEALDKLGGVARAAADGCDLYGALGAGVGLCSLHECSFL